MAASTGLGKLCTSCDNVTYALNGPCVVRPRQLERCRYQYAVYAVGVHVSTFVHLKLKDAWCTQYRCARDCMQLCILPGPSYCRKLVIYL